MRSAIIVLVLFIIPVIALSAVIEVPKDYPTIQSAIDAAVKDDTVLVAPGTYVENIDFKGKAITVTSSGIAGVSVIDGNQAGSVVSFTSGEGPDSVLDGFTLTNGTGINILFDYYGGGIYCYSSSPTITNNTIFGNLVLGDGGGIYCHSSSPTITHNTIKENLVDYLGGGIACMENSSLTITYHTITENSADYFGGGIHCDKSSSAIIVNNTISRNLVGDPMNSYGYGGGIYSHSSTTTIKNNTITENSSLYGNGGGICCFGCSPTITNNTISWNSASSSGGGIACDHYSSPIINNNTLSGNQAQYGGGISCYFFSSFISLNNTITENSAWNGGGIFCGTSNLNIISTILWNNSVTGIGPEICLGQYNSPSVVTILFSDVKGGKPSIYVDPSSTLNWGAGMIDSDPLFVNPAISDFHLTFNSPCMGSGNNAAVTELYDFEGDPRITYGTVDMGADEFYTHLYHTGNTSPGGTVELKLVDLPGTNPVILWVGSGVLRTPINTKYGNWYLQLPPLLDMRLGSIATPSGVTVLPYTFDPNFPIMDIPMQALIGKKLTNLCVIKVK